jgi:hypothetical protein
VRITAPGARSKEEARRSTRSKRDVGLPWEGATQFEVSVLDAEGDLTSVQTGRLASGTRLVQTLRAPMVCLIKLRCPINEW